MSIVDKMLIKGIRSFSPENTHVITFHRPLTLIVGANGAGKTTIIECLKHACTGELPPNSRSGQSFIHDPKVAGETETKGQIKLRFKTAAGKDVVCIRSFQLTQKGAKMEFKAIESVLQTIDAQTGEKVCLSYRCADMDREVPTLMGVSKAVIENVIFAHQDDANWPLAEGSVLKKKFDDIFSATRYTKALEVIKKLHKDQAQEIKMYKLKLENLQTLKDAAFKLRDGIQEDLQKATHLQSQIDDLEMKIKTSEQKKESVEACLVQISGLQTEISVKEAKRETLVKVKAKQYQDLEEENEDADEELANWKTQFETKLTSVKLNISSLERELSDSEKKIQILVQTFIKDSQTKGKLQAELEAHVQQKHDRDRSIQALYSKQNLGGIGDLPLNNDIAVKYLEKAACRLDELAKDHEQRKEADDKDIAMLWAAVEKGAEKLSLAQGKINAKLDQKRSKMEDMQRLEDAIKNYSLSTSKSDLRRLDDNETSSRDEMEKRSHVLSVGDFDTNIFSTKAELASLEEKVRVLQREKDGLASESMDRIYLRSKKDELVNKESALSQILEENKATLIKVLKGTMPVPKDLKAEVVGALSSRKDEVAKLNENLVEAGKEVVRVTSMLQEAKLNLKKHERDRDARRKGLMGRLNALFDVNTEPEAFPNHLTSVKTLRDQKQQNHDLADGMRRMFDPFERLARSNHVCPCCERAFSPEEEDDFVKKQRTKSSSTAERLRQLKLQKDDAENKLQALEKARVLYDEYQKLSQELIPAAQRACEELTKECEAATVPHDDLLGLLAQANSEFEVFDGLRGMADSVDRLHHEIMHLQKQICEDETKLDMRSQAFRNLDHVNNDLIQVEGKRHQANKKLEHLREEQSIAKDEFAKWSMRYHNAREEKLKAIHNVETLKKLKDDREKLGEQITDIELDIEMLQDSLGPLSKQKEALVQEHDARKKKVEEENAESSWELRNFRQEIGDLKSVSLHILTFVASGKEARFKEISDRLLSFKAQQENEERKKTEMAEDLKKKKELKENQASVMRNVDDNIQYRKTVKEIQQLDKEIMDLETQMIALGEKQIVEADLRRLIENLQDLTSQKSRNQGTLAVYRTNATRQKADLKQVQYKDIDNRYCGQLIQLKTTEMANKDLDKYYSALDKALMRFHSMKMAEINKIIKELWQQTYRGQDIDYIEIRSDAEGAGTRSYSYRVIMRSGDAELEMRGRCSAGQKVLASLIIRLALAETFCLNCGILALDEPTTNLDGPNTASLASALVRIMEDRKSQENFQLIVITHDERFAQLIGQREHAEQYYRICKDDHQHSIIEAQEIFD